MLFIFYKVGIFNLRLENIKKYFIKCINIIKFIGLTILFSIILVSPFIINEIIVNIEINNALGKLYNLYTGEILNRYIKFDNIDDTDLKLVKAVIDNAKKILTSEQSLEIEGILDGEI